MKVSEITSLLKKHGFIKLTPEQALDENYNPDKSYFKYDGNLNIKINDKLGFEILAKKNDIGLGLYIKGYIDENGDAHQNGTYWPELFFTELIKEIENA